MLKRKFQGPELEMKKCQKMSTSLIGQGEGNPNSGLLRNLPFKLTDQTARKNLIAGTKRINFEKESKQKSAKLKFSAGAYMVVVLPTLKIWKDLKGSLFSYGGLKIKIDEVKEGLDENSKHFDTKVVMTVEEMKVVIHSYNSTQNMKVDGKGYIQCIERYLEPYFNEKIEKMENSIAEWNKNILNTLNKPTRTTPVTRSTRYKPVTNFKCKNCEFVSLSHRQLKMHKISQHTRNLDDSQISQDTSTMDFQHSTRDNSFCEQLLVEDMTITDISSINNVRNTALEEIDLSPRKIPTDIQKIEKSEITEDIKIPSQSVFMESLKSCDKCDFETEDMKELKIHQDKNVHDIVNKNNTIGCSKLELPQVALKCGFCDYTVTDKKSLDDHGYQKHGLINCEKCEYGALDEDIMKKHMMTHTGRIVFMCNICEFETTRQSMLENHMESKHPKNENQSVKHYCEKCEQEFLSSLHLDYHHCKPQFKYPCHVCQFMGLSVVEVLTHLNEDHVKCHTCNHIANTEKDLNEHIQLIHKKVAIEITSNEKVQIKCEQCDYKCNLNIQLKKHQKSAHVTKETETKYFCEECAYSTKFVLHLWEHREINHPGHAILSKPKPKDVALSLLAEQNMDIIEDLGSLKALFKAVFIEFAGQVGTVLEDVRKDILEASTESMKKVNELDVKVNSYLNLNELNGKKETETEKKREANKVEKKNVKNTNTHENKKNTKKHDVEKVFHKNGSRRFEKASRNVAWIGSSISKVLDVKKF